VEPLVRETPHVAVPARSARAVPAVVTEPDLGPEVAVALGQALHAEGIDHPGPAGLHSAWHAAGLREGVERGAS
jgi:hypothetical protein